MIELLFQVSGFLFLLILLHELGHVAAAKLLGIPIDRVGVSAFPVPHFYVAIQWPRATRDRNIYLLAGFLVYLIILLFCLINGFFDSRALIIALGIQAIIETNPIYSDFIIIKVIEEVYQKIRGRRNYRTIFREVYDKYLFSKGWYLHFGVWCVVLISVISIIQSS